MRPTIITHYSSTLYSYSVSADTCESPKITVEYKGLSMDKARQVAMALEGAFRKVDVICEQTGEVMYNVYYSSEYYNKGYTCADALKVVEHYLD